MSRRPQILLSETSTKLTAIHSPQPSLPITWINASGAKSFCSGSLVAPDRVLTAAHCLCPIDGGAPIAASITFGDATGHNLAQFWPAAAWVAHPQASVCGSPWSGPTTNDPEHTSDHDVAIVTIGQNTNGGTQPALPPITPIPLSLDDPRLSFGPQSVGHRLLSGYWVVGWGNNFSSAAFSAPDRCVGCGIRRSGPINDPFLIAATCHTFPFTSVKTPFPQDCWEGWLWTAASVASGKESVEITHGDSGGPLLFNVSGPSTGIIGGVASSFFFDGLGPPTPFPHQSHWATTGDNADFLWSAIGLPFTFPVAQLQSNVAIFALDKIYINDRAHILQGSSSNGAAIVANGEINIGVEAVVGDVSSASQVFLRDRAAVGNVNTRGTISIGSSVTAASTSQGVFQKFDNVSSSMPPGVTFPSPIPQTFVTQPNQSFAPGIYGDVTVYAGASIHLTDGMYVFHKLDLESHSVLTKTGAGNTWVFVATEYNVTLRGQVLAPPGQLFIAAPNVNNGYINVNDDFSATIVAPGADVEIDMMPFATFTGSAFGHQVRIHQGDFFRFVPFAGGWNPTCTNGFQSCN